MMAVSLGDKKCFACDENPRENGDFLCSSCKEEYPMCYKCGQRRRNYPFKLCTQCYRSNRSRSSVRSSETGDIDGMIKVLDLGSGQSDGIFNQYSKTVLQGL